MMKKLIAKIKYSIRKADLGYKVAVFLILVGLMVIYSSVHGVAASRSRQIDALIKEAQLKDRNEQLARIEIDNQINSLNATIMQQKDAIQALVNKEIQDSGMTPPPGSSIAIIDIPSSSGSTSSQSQPRASNPTPSQSSSPPSQPSQPSNPPPQPPPTPITTPPPSQPPVTVPPVVTLPHTCVPFIMCLKG